MICIIDNYDSFTYNLVQIIAQQGWPYIVYKNDEVDIDRLRHLSDQITGFLISPGPGHPKEAGVSRDVVHEFHRTHKIFGVCLGHQVIAEYFKAQVVSAPRIMHGHTSQIYHNGTLYRHLPQPFEATRYHSLIVTDLPPDLELTAWTQTESGTPEIMGIKHREWKIEGVQFHPESILSKGCEALLIEFFKD